MQTSPSSTVLHDMARAQSEEPPSLLLQTAESRNRSELHSESAVASAESQSLKEEAQVISPTLDMKEPVSTTAFKLDDNTDVAMDEALVTVPRRQSSSDKSSAPLRKRKRSQCQHHSSRSSRSSTTTASSGDRLRKRGLKEKERGRGRKRKRSLNASGRRSRDRSQSEKSNRTSSTSSSSNSRSGSGDMSDSSNLSRPLTSRYNHHSVASNSTGSSTASNGRNDGRHIIEFSMPEKYAKIITETSSTVAFIERQSGAHVKFASEPHNDQRLVTIRGSKDDVESAHEMIEEELGLAITLAQKQNTERMQQQDADYPLLPRDLVQDSHPQLLSSSHLSLPLQFPPFTSTPSSTSTRRLSLNLHGQRDNEQVPFLQTLPNSNAHSRSPHHYSLPLDSLPSTLPFSASAVPLPSSPLPPPFPSPPSTVLLAINSKLANPALSVALLPPLTGVVSAPLSSQSVSTLSLTNIQARTPLDHKLSLDASLTTVTPMLGPPLLAVAAATLPAAAPDTKSVPSTASRTQTGLTRVTDVPGKKMGVVIGRGGANIKEIEKRTGARLNVDHGDKTASFRKVHISGASSAIEEAETLIRRLCEEGDHILLEYVAPPIYSTSTRASPVPPRISMTSLQQASGAPSYMMPNYSHGSEEKRDSHQDMHRNTLNNVSAVKHFLPLQPSMGVFDMGGSKGFSDMGRQPLRESIAIPQNCVGFVIGKGGQTIREFQDHARCQIKMEPPGSANNPPDQRIVHLSGDDATSIQIARQLIMAKVDENMRRNGRGVPNQVPQGPNGLQQQQCVQGNMTAMQSGLPSVPSLSNGVSNTMRSMPSVPTYSPVYNAPNQLRMTTMGAMPSVMSQTSLIPQSMGPAMGHSAYSVPSLPQQQPSIASTAADQAYQQYYAWYYQQYYNNQYAQQQQMPQIDMQHANDLSTAGRMAQAAGGYNTSAMHSNVYNNYAWPGTVGQGTLPTQMQSKQPPSS